jgi:hypothetical protein
MSHYRLNAFRATNEIAPAGTGANRVTQPSGGLVLCR